jgi:ABC-type transport system substrate-binding protein
LNTGDTQTRRVEHQFDIASCGMAAVFDPDAWLPLFRSDSFLNYSGMVDPEIDKAVDDTRSSLDPEARQEAYARLQQRLADQLPWFFISEAVLATATTPGVHGMDSWTLPDGSPGTSKQFWLPFTAEALWVDPAGG